jgi:hypothetical protein
VWILNRRVVACQFSRVEILEHQAAVLALPDVTKVPELVGSHAKLFTTTACCMALVEQTGIGRKAQRAVILYQEYPAF